MIAYKLFRQRKDGTIGSIYHNRSLRIPIGEWIEADEYPIPEHSPRKGWHSFP